MRAPRNSTPPRSSPTVVRVENPPTSDFPVNGALPGRRLPRGPRAHLFRRTPAGETAGRARTPEMKSGPLCRRLGLPAREPSRAHCRRAIVRPGRAREERDLRAEPENASGSARGTAAARTPCACVAADSNSARLAGSARQVE